MALENNQGNPMSNGYTQDANKLNEFVMKLNTTMGSIETQLAQISKSLGGQSKLLEKLNGNTERELQEERQRRKESKNVEKALDTLIKNAKESQVSSEKVLGYLTYGNKQSKKENTRADADIALGKIADYTNKLELLQERYNAYQNNEAGSLNKLADLLNHLGINITNNTNITDATQEAVDDLGEELAKLKSTIDNYEAHQKQLSDNIKKLSTIGSGTHFQSTYLQKLSKEQEKLSYAEDFAKEVSETKKSVEESIKAILEKMESADDNEKVLLQKQLGVAEKQKKYLENLNPLTNAVRNFTSGVKGTLISTGMNMLTGQLDHLQDKYLDSFIEGFSRVYQSIETTRNSISARSKLDAGAFESIQDTIHERIEAEGLTGAISNVEVNEALVSLSAAGITNEKMMTELALEQAKLKAAGSSINLLNEEMLSNIMTRVQSGDELSDILNVIDQIEATVQYQRDELGQDIAFVNGGIDTLINNELKNGITNQQSLNVIASNMQEAVGIAGGLQTIGIDPSFMQQIVTDIRTQDIQNLPVWQAVLHNEDLSAETLKNYSNEQIAEMFLNSLNTYMGNASITELSAISSALGLGTDADTLRRLQSSNFKIDVKKMSTEQLTESTENIYKGLQKYVSETEKTNTERENAMYEQAVQAEKIYEGDKLVLKEVEAVKSGVKSMIGLLGTLVAQGSKSLFSGRGGSPTTGTQLPTGGGTAGTPTVGGGVSSWSYGKSTGNVVGDFFTGARGTKSGAIGRGAMGVYGLYNFGASIGENVVYDEQGAIDFGATARETILDEDSWKSAGQSIGGFVGGPIAGYVVGELWGKASKVGTLIGVKAAESVGDKLYDSMLSELNNTAEEQKSAAQAQLDAVNKQIEATNLQISAINKMSENELKLTLVDEYGYSLEELEGKSVDDLKQTLKNVSEGKLSNLKGTASSAASKLSAETFRTQNMSTLVELATSVDPSSWLNEMTSDGAKINEQTGLSYNLEAITNAMAMAGDKDFLYKLQAQIMKEETEHPERSRGSIIKDLLGENASEGQVENIESLMSELDILKIKYDDANSEFHKRWDKAKALAGSSDMKTIYEAYRAQLYKDYPNAINLPESVYTKYNDGNTPNLPTGDGRYWPQYYEGKFASGLTQVPSDGYKAILHSGERVLTKREAEVYNTIVPDLVEAVTNTYNTYSSNPSSGSSGVKDEISSQTNSLVDVLNKILDVLTSMNRGRYTNPIGVGISNAFLNMNSDVTQTSTSYR